MVFSGYTRTELNQLQLPGVDQLLLHTDVLVDGPYEMSLPDQSRLWVGSTNQQYHYLSSRYDSQIETDDAVERALEVHIGSNGSIFVNGWPEKISTRQIN